MKKDYHKYVFNNKKFIGDFETMYKNSKDIPWNQNNITNFIDTKIVSYILDSKYDVIYDLCCGLGYYLNFLKENFGNKSCKTIGYDISKTCCKKAEKIFKNTIFNINDITKSIKIDSYKGKKLYCLRGSLFYLCTSLENVIKNIDLTLKEKDDLLIVQNFPNKNKFIYSDVLPDYNTIINLFSRKFKLINYIYIESLYDDKWFLGQFKKK